MTDATDQARLTALAERFWRFECEEVPFSAVLAGVPTHDAVLFRESLQDHARRYAGSGALLAELDGIPTAGLEGQALATHRLLRHELSTARRGYETLGHLRPSLFPVGPDFNTIYFANLQVLGDLEAARLYVARLATLPAFLDDLRDNLATGVAAGIRYPRRVLECGLATSRSSTVGAPDASAWFTPLSRSPAAAHAGFSALADEALALIRDRIYPALAAYGDFLAGPLMSVARDSVSCTDAPGGSDFYGALVRQYTTTDLDPPAIHALGLSEVERLTEAMDAIAAKAGYPGDVTGYRAFLSSDPQFYAPSPERLREQLEVLCKRIDRRIPSFFGRVPRITYGVDSIPAALSPNLPPAYAQPSPANRSTAGVFWVTSQVAKCPSYMHVPLALHEGWPGHLMHIALIQEMDRLPAFRRYGAVKYTACIEGWALYCEGLGHDFGLYETPHQEYGRLEFEMWRAVRLVVDTGIHWYGWSRDQAIAYMGDRLALPGETIQSEVDRYIALPGQALAYQIGNLRIRALRARAEETLGDRFSLRAFHDEFMGVGAVTIPVLEELLGGWITRQASPGAGHG